ncbi:MAG: ccoS [Segetibacter sp.]|nr:ccoS [Segetibacter sp.]
MITIIFRVEDSQPYRLILNLLLKPGYNTMSAIFILLIVSITIAAGFLVAFLWTVKAGQYDDEISPPIRILFDEAPTLKNKK